MGLFGKPTEQAVEIKTGEEKVIRLNNGRELIIKDMRPRGERLGAAMVFNRRTCLEKIDVIGGSKGVDGLNVAYLGAE